MADFKIKWDQTGEKLFETGIDRGVFYPIEDSGKYTNGEAWNGLTAFEESKSGGEPTAVYANNKKYVELSSNEEYGGTIKAYTYPDGFDACQGFVELEDGVVVTQQTHKRFGFTYRTLLGNDLKDIDLGYKIHLVYNAFAKPASMSSTTINDNIEAKEMSWEITTTAAEVNKAGIKPTAHIVIDSTKCDPAKLTKIENLLYGSGGTEAKLPTVDEIIALLADG